jgi:hypothetical protein
MQFPGRRTAQRAEMGVSGCFQEVGECFDVADNRIACKAKRLEGTLGSGLITCATSVGDNHRNEAQAAACRSVGSIPISVAIPTMATDRIPQSRNASVSGVPSNADMVI